MITNHVQIGCGEKKSRLQNSSVTVDLISLTKKHKNKQTKNSIEKHRKKLPKTLTTMSIVRILGLENFENLMLI